MSEDRTFLWVIGAILLTVVGFIAIPPLMKKVERKIYKRSLKRDYVDYDNLGPEIVKTEKKAGDNQ